MEKTWVVLKGMKGRSSRERVTWQEMEAMGQGGYLNYKEERPQARGNRFLFLKCSQHANHCPQAGIQQSARPWIGGLRGLPVCWEGRQSQQYAAMVMIGEG